MAAVYISAHLFKFCLFVFVELWLKDAKTFYNIAKKVICQINRLKNRSGLISATYCMLVSHYYNYTVYILHLFTEIYSY